MVSGARPQDPGGDESEALLRAVVEAALDGIVTIDEQGTIEFVNPMARRIFGYERDELVGQNISILMPDSYRRQHSDAVVNYLRTGQAKIIGRGREVEGRRKDGTVFPLALAVSETFLESGRRLFIGIVRDITEHKQAETERERLLTKLAQERAQLNALNETLEDKVEQRTEALLRSNRELKETRDLFRKLFNVNPFPAAIIREADGLFVDVNEEFLRYFALGRDELVGFTDQQLNLWLAADDREHFILDLQASSRISRTEVKLRHPAGEARTVLVSVDRIDYYSVPCLVVALVDITKRVRAEAKIRQLATELTLAEQRERQRIALILHDELQQMLVALKLQMHLLMNHGKLETQTQLPQLEDYVDKAIDLTRNLAVEFGSSVHVGETLEERLAQLSQMMEARYGLQVKLEVQDSRSVEDKDIRELVYQLLRELLFNVVKHGGVSEAKLSAWECGEELFIRVEDEGRGFDVEEALQRGGSGAGFGLFSARERLELFGGRMELDSTPGEGTKVTLIFPN